MSVTASCFTGQLGCAHVSAGGKPNKNMQQSFEAHRMLFPVGPLLVGCTSASWHGSICSCSLPPDHSASESHLSVVFDFVWVDKGIVLYMSWDTEPF